MLFGPRTGGFLIVIVVFCAKTPDPTQEPRPTVGPAHAGEHPTAPAGSRSPPPPRLGPTAPGVGSPRRHPVSVVFGPVPHRPWPPPRPCHGVWRPGRDRSR